MKGYIKLLLKVIMACMVVLGSFNHTIKADDFIQGISTAYCLNGITYSGEPVREGYCAGAEKYLGKIIKIYQRLPDNSVGKYLGTFICKDTGSSKMIQNGYCIDVWMEDEEKCQEWMDKVYSDGCEGNIFFVVIDKNF